MSKCNFIDNFSTTTTATTGIGADTLTIPTGDADTLSSYVDSSVYAYVQLTLDNGSDVQVVKATDVNTGTGVVTFEPVSSYSFASGTAVEVRIPKDALDVFMQKHVTTSVDSGLFDSEIASVEIAANTTIYVYSHAPGDRMQLLLKNTGGTPTLTFSPQGDTCLIVWPDDTPPAFGTGAELLNIEFVRSSLTANDYFSSHVIFGKWSASTIPT